MATETVLRAATTSSVRGRTPAVDQFYLTAADNFRVTVNVRFLTTVTVNLSWRLIRAEDGRVQVAQTSKVLFPGADPEVFLVKLDEGVLLNAQLWVDTVSGLQYGIVYGRVEIVRGFDGALTSLATVIQGYLTNATPLGWPGTPLQAMHEGAGAITSPAWSISTGPPTAQLIVPANVRWRPICGSVLFITSAVAGARSASLAVRNPAGAITYVAQWNTALVASTLNRMVFAAGVHANDPAVPSQEFFTYPNDLELAAASSIDITAGVSFAGDSFSAESAIVREWMDR